MNHQKIKIILYLPLALLFIANIFYFPLSAKAEESYSWLYTKDAALGTRTCSGMQLGEQSNDMNCEAAGLTKPAMCNTNPADCVCCGKTTTSSDPAAAANMPKLTIPDLQIKIPGLAPFTAPDCTETNGVKTCSSNWIGEYIAGIYKYAIGIVGILAAVVLMIGGVMWIVAGGSATMIGEAKAWIGASLTGLVIALCSYAILYQVNPALVGFKALTLGVVQDIKPEEITYTSGGGKMGTSVIPTNPTVRDKYDALLKTAGYDCTTSKAIMFAESSGNPGVTSPAGAVGLMQLMPATAQSLGVTGNLYEPQTNINAGEKYLKQLSSTACNGSTSNAVCNTSDIKYIIAAYNGGPKANKPSVTCPGKTYYECEANTGYAETRKYVGTVLANINSLKNNGGACQ